MQYDKFLTGTLRGAAEIASRMFGKTTSQQKHDQSVVTEADLAVGKFIIGEIEKHYPDYNIIDEESGVIDRNSEYTWVVDPIDGTANFAVGIPLYGVMMGLLKGDRPVAGAFILPYFKEVYLAEKDQGVFCNGKKLALQDRSDFSRMIIACNINNSGGSADLVRQQMQYQLGMVMEFYGIGGSGSVFDDAMLLKGGYRAVCHNSGKIWDYVSTQIIVEEAGGVITDFSGKPLDFSGAFEKAESRQGYTACSALPSVHKKIQQIIHGVK